MSLINEPNQGDLPRPGHSLQGDGGISPAVAAAVGNDVGRRQYAKQAGAAVPGVGLFKLPAQGGSGGTGQESPPAASMEDTKGGAGSGADQDSLHNRDRQHSISIQDQETVLAVLWASSGDSYELRLRSGGWEVPQELETDWNQRAESQLQPRSEVRVQERCSSRE